MTFIQRWLRAALVASLVSIVGAAAGCDDSNANPIPDDSPIPRTTRAGHSAAAVAGRTGTAGVSSYSEAGRAGGAGVAGGGAGAGAGTAGSVSVVITAGTTGAAGAAGKPATGPGCKALDIDSDNGSSRSAYDNTILAKWPNGTGDPPVLP
jgi:hypothetical protein